MKIFVEADSIAYERMSGIGHATLELLRGLDAKIAAGADLHVTAVIPKGTTPLFKGYGFVAIRTKELPIAQKYINYALTRTWLPIPIDLWLGRGVYIFPNYKTWYTPCSKSVTFVHDVVFKILPDTVNIKNLSYLEANFNRWLRRASVIATITKASAVDIQSYFPSVEHKLHVVPLGVDPAIYYRRSQAECFAASEKYSLPHSYLLFVGNLEPRKNILRLFEAYERYVDNSAEPLALVLIGGDGWNNGAILTKIDEMKKTGMQVIRPKLYVEDEDLPALYSGAHYVLHWALHEGFGLPPLQAEACGTPVIASNIASLREILDKSSTTFIDVDDVTGMARALTNPPSPHSVSWHGKLTWTNSVNRLLSVIAMIK